MLFYSFQYTPTSQAKSQKDVSRRCVCQDKLNLHDYEDLMLREYEICNLAEFVSVIPLLKGSPAG